MFFAAKTYKVFSKKINRYNLPSLPIIFKLHLDMTNSDSQNSNGNGNFPNDSFAAFNLQKTYGRRRVVEDVSLYVEQGEVVGLLGANGSGKMTTFLYDDRV